MVGPGDRGEQAGPQIRAALGVSPPAVAVPPADLIQQSLFTDRLRHQLGPVYAHRLRHTAATRMLAAGASLPEIGQVLRRRSRAAGWAVRWDTGLAYAFARAGRAFLGRSMRAEAQLSRANR